MIHTYLISCGNHFIVTPLYIYTFVHIFVRHKSLSWQEDMFITTDPPMNLLWTYRDWRRNHQPGRKVSVSPLSGAKYPSQSQNHPRASSCRPLPVEKCQWQPSEKLWETCLCFPMNSGKRALFQRTSTVSQDVRYNPIWKSSCEMFPGQKKHPAEATKQKKIRSGSNIKTPVISNHLIVNLTLSCTTVFVCF